MLISICVFWNNVTMKLLDKVIDKWNKTCLSLLIAFSSLSNINTALKISITILWSFKLHYVIATTSSWCWKEISYNDVTSVSIHSRSTSRWKSNKKSVSPQYCAPKYVDAISQNLKSLTRSSNGLFVLTDYG